MPAALVVLLTLASGATPRGGFYVEGPPARTRTEALAVVREATSRGWTARVTRRYELGSGWWWVPRVDGFDAEGDARAAAQDLSARTGWSLAVYPLDGFSDVDAGDERQASAPPAATAPADREPSSAVMARAVAAHGGSTGGAVAIGAAEAVLFRFRRTLPDGTVVDHTWARSGEDLYLEVQPVHGTAVPSRSGVSASGAWLEAGDQPARDQDLVRARAMLAAFGPRAVLAFPLAFADVASKRPELQLLHVSGEVEVDGERCALLAYDGGRGGSRIELAVGAETGLVREVRLGDRGGVVAHRFSSYREVATGVVVPGRVQTWHGSTPADDVEVFELDLAPRLPPEWFEARR